MSKRVRFWVLVVVTLILIVLFVMARTNFNATYQEASQTLNAP